MSLVKDVAIVLRRLDYSETSQVLVLFTREHGQQRVIAKGVKRPTKTKPSIGIDLLEMGDLTFSRRPGKEDVLATLTEWRQLDNFAHRRRSLELLNAAQYAAEVTSQLTEVHDPHPALFDALREMLASTDPALGVLCRFLWRLLTEIGLRPELGRCMNCSRPVTGDPTIYFSSREGGAICRDCEPAAVEKRRVNPAALAWLADECAGVPAAPDAVFDMLDHHLANVMGRPAKLSKLLRQSSELRPIRPAKEQAR